MKVIIEQGKSKKWYWKIVGANGKTLATSETYSSKDMAKKTWEKVVIAIYSKKLNEDGI